MASVNKVILIGNLGKDPDTRYLQDGKAVTKFSVATSESWKDKTTGEKQEKTEWHNIEVWGKLAEICAQYLTKGSSVYIDGKLQTDKYQDKTTGTDRYTTKVVANEMRMLSPKSNSAPPHDAGFDTPPAAAPRQQAASRPATPANPAVTAGFDDDIPF